MAAQTSTAAATCATPERRVRVQVVPSKERGIHRLIFRSAPVQGRRYVLVTKSGDFAERNSEDFHWVATFEPFDAEAPTDVCVEIETGMWCFRSDVACVSYGILESGETDPALPSWGAEYDSVAIMLRPALTCDSDSQQTFVPECERLPEELRAGYRRFYEVYDEIDGHEVSWQDTQHMGPVSGLTYGESHFVPTYELLQSLRVQPGEVLVDLGSGTGRVVLAAALGFPRLGRCVGIELLPGLHGAALDALAATQREDGTCSTNSAHLPCAPVELIKGDLLEGDWPATATLVVAMSLCFPAAMLEALERRCLELPVGARIIAMHDAFGTALGGAIRPLPLRDEEPRHGVRLEMSFGMAPLFVFERVGADGTVPAAFDGAAAAWLDTMD
eukprot:TRINITY_DN33950_c0_g1_i1.p1 TRINITY_DN33950_c0_g1~~TRINITY_DN33950_c0_g1_i1.p1  ORF type:complete len:452 (-),score=85.14 TRINITY_DN33950_c0_g1_i1:72-1235(-)